MNSRAEKCAGKPAVFLDRDGTLIEDARYLARADQIRLLDGSLEALRLARSAGLATVLVTNQSAIGRAWLSESELHEIHTHLSALLESGGARLDGIYFCPHHPEAVLDEYRRVCPCRKPNPGMLLQAAEDLELDLASSLMVGDRLRDVEAGRRAGCRTVLVETGYGSEEWRARRPTDPQPDHIAPNLLQAVRWFLELGDTD